MSRNRREADVERGDVERTLLAFLKRPDDEKPALRARIRHLSTLGLLELPKVGSGKRISYTDEHVFWMALALTLEAIGQSPKKVVEIVSFVRSEIRLPLDKQLYLLLEPETVRFADRKTVEEVAINALALSTINLTKIQSELSATCDANVAVRKESGSIEKGSTVTAGEHVYRED